MCKDIKRTMASRPELETCRAASGPVALFPPPEESRFGKQGRFLSKTCFVQIHFLLENWCSLFLMREMITHLVQTLGWQREAMFAGGKALADCLRRRFFRPSATWQGTLPSPQLPPLLRSSLRPPTLHTPCPATRPALRQFW